jgi:hypothetical protein
MELMWTVFREPGVSVGGGDDPVECWSFRQWCREIGADLFQ